MSLEPDNIGHKAAAMAESDDHPGWPRLPETDATHRIASLIARHLTPPWLTQAALQAVAAKVIANRAAIRAIFDELDQDPRRLRDGDVVLRRQTTAHHDDRTWLMEQAAYHKQCWREFCALAEAAGAHPRDVYDPDERNADEDDRRISDEVAAERAVDGMGSVA